MHHRYQQHRWCTLSCEYLRKFSTKFETTLIGYSGVWGKLIHEKKQKSKISWHCPLKLTGTDRRYVLNVGGTGRAFLPQKKTKKQFKPSLSFTPRHGLELLLVSLTVFKSVHIPFNLTVCFTFCTYNDTMTQLDKVMMYSTYNLSVLPSVFCSFLLPPPPLLFTGYWGVVCSRISLRRASRTLFPRGQSHERGKLLDGREEKNVFCPAAYRSVWQLQRCSEEHYKGTVPRDFHLQVFFMKKFPPSPWVYHSGHFKFVWKFSKGIHSSRCPLSLTPVAICYRYQQHQQYGW